MNLTINFDELSKMHEGIIQSIESAIERALWEALERIGVRIDGREEFLMLVPSIEVNYGNATDTVYWYTARGKREFLMRTRWTYPSMNDVLAYRIASARFEILTAPSV